MPHFVTILIVTLCCNDILDSFEKLYKYQKQWVEFFKKRTFSDYKNMLGRIKTRENTSEKC